MPETTQFGGNDDSSSLDGALKPNTILVARYKITAVLGGGGQGAVYQARDLNFPDARRFVAVKEMHVTASDPNLRASTMKTFQREANILATLAHPAIPRIYDFFENNDRAYLIMEYINGNNLEEILIKTKKLPITKIIEWAIDLCDVLGYLHANPNEPIIFRDMKPANIMIDSLGKVRLVDFGIAKIFVSGVKQTMIGTEGYSAPEQYKGNANPLSDIYSLGATLHQVITRKDPRLEPPFSFQERPITDFNEEATPALQAIVEKSLAFEPENRYTNCLDMKKDLEALRYGSLPANIQVATPGGASTGADGGDGETSFFDEVSDAGIQPRWTFKTEDEIRSTPSIFKDTVFVGSYDTNIWAIDLSEGSFRWKYATEGGIASSPVIEEQTGQVLFGSEDNTYYAVSVREGRLNWTYNTSDKIRSTGSVAHGHVFFGSDDGKLYALMANSGRHMWDYDTGVPVRTRPVVTNDRIIFGTEGGEVIGLELNGQRKWGFRARKAVSSSPVVDIEGVCYVGSFDNYLYAIDADSGYSHWRIRTNGPIISSPAVDGNLVFIGSADGKMYAINTQTGKERWTFETGAAIVASAIVHENIVYFGSTDKKFYAVDAKRGKEIWSFETDGAITSTAAIANDMIIFGSLDMTVYALPLVSQ
jgi:serine/threonine protein kinase